MIDRKLLIDKNCSVRSAIEKLVIGEKRTIFVVDKKDKLLGIFTNGDMRKALLLLTDLSVPVEKVMNKNPIVFKDRKEAYNYSKNKFLIVYPIVKNGILVDVVFYDGFSNEDSNEELKNVPLVMIAGGKGTRLYPYTKILPKALIPIGDLTISERIINSFVRYGCRNVFFILNHKANMIKAYYNDLEREYNVSYEVEKEFLGTGGGLYLIKDKINSTFIMTNCDILIEDDLSCAYRTHKLNENKITIICSSKDFSIPYGVIKSNENGDVVGIEEKPCFNYLVNTGVYIVEPDVFNYLSNKETIGMPDLVLRCQQKGLKIGIFPVSDKSWLDMGQFDTMNKMLNHFNK